MYELWNPECTEQFFKFLLGSRPGKPKERKGQNEKFMNFANFCEFCVFLGKTNTIHKLNFCSGMPPGKVHELAFLWFGLLGWLLIFAPKKQSCNHFGGGGEGCSHAVLCCPFLFTGEILKEPQDAFDHNKGQTPLQLLREKSRTLAEHNLKRINCFCLF